MMKKKLMVLGASITNKCSLLEISKMRDVDLIILDGDPNSIGKNIAQHFEYVDIRQSDEVLKMAKKYHIDGIFSINDHGMRAAAYVADNLNLKGMSMATANAVLDKGTMREVWKAAGIQQPAFQIILKENEIEEFGRSCGYPIVIKPVDCGGGGRGVRVIHTPDDIPQSYSFASRFLQWNPRLIIEEFIDGIETSVEVIRFDGVTHLLAFSDKVKAPYSSRVATEISYPGFFSSDVVEDIRGSSDKIMRALGLHEGVGHIEFIVTKDKKVVVLEIGARAGGGHTFHPIASHVSGLNYPQWLSKFYLGEAEPPKVNSHKGACYAFFHADASGTLRDIDGLDKAREIPNIHSVDIWKQPVSHVSILENSMERLGCIVALAETRDDANRAALQARQEIRLHVTPLS